MGCQSYSICSNSNISGKLQNLAPKFGATSQELIFEEENFSGNLQDLIENLHTLNMLVSNVSLTEETNLKQVNVTDADKGRSLEEDFVFNDVALESVENLADYKDELDPIYGLDDPNNIISIDDVIASVTIRVDDQEEEASKENDKDKTKKDTTKEMKAGETLLIENETVIASVTIRVDDREDGPSKENNLEKNKEETTKETKTEDEETLLKENEKKGKWDWRRRRRESEKAKKKSNVFENHISQTIVRDSEVLNKENEGEDIEGFERVREEESEQRKVKVGQRQELQQRGRKIGDASDRGGRGDEGQGGQGGMKRVEDERSQQQFQGGIKQRGRKKLEIGIKHGKHGPKRKSEEVQREIQQEEDVFGKTRVRRQVLDAVLVPCKTGHLCIISGPLMKTMFKTFIRRTSFLRLSVPTLIIFECITLLPPSVMVL